MLTRVWRRYSGSGGRNTCRLSAQERLRRPPMRMLVDVSQQLPCRYPRSHATAEPIQVELANLAANKNLCTTIDLDTLQSQSSGGESHYQGLARSHKLSDGSIYWFLAHSNLNATFGDYLMFRGNISQFRYTGTHAGRPRASDGSASSCHNGAADQSVRSAPVGHRVFARLNGADAGYLFVAGKYSEYQCSICRWQPF